MLYPSNWLQQPLHRRIVEAARQFEEYTLLLRPMRRHLFIQTYDGPSAPIMAPLVESCFGALCRATDPDMKPCVVIETEKVHPKLKALYEQRGVLWAYFHEAGNQFVLDCYHAGTRMHIEDKTGNLTKLLAAPLAWYERGGSTTQGYLVHSFSEQFLRAAVLDLAPRYGVECHHQVALNWIVRPSAELTPEERRLFRHEIDAVVMQSFELDQYGTVVLPIKLDLHGSHRTDARVARRDQAIRELCERFGVPLLTIRPGSAPDCYEFSCPVLSQEVLEVQGMTVPGWSEALEQFLYVALQWLGRL